MLYLKNNLLNIAINPIGAELTEISSVKRGTQFMWNADPTIWANYAPNLFPIVGMLKNESYHFEGKDYQLPKHGFIRNNPNFKIDESSDARVVLKLQETLDTLKSYPFQFEYYVIFELDKHELTVTYKVVNTHMKTIYFSLGGHPAFKCPVYEDENYDDYRLVFENDETSETHLLNLENGLVTNETKRVFNTSNSINLYHELFEHDALIFKDLKSRKVKLKSNNHGTVITLHYKDFPYFGVWAKTNGNYVCLEPWLGIADSDNSNQQLTQKEGIITLEPHKEFEASYKIEIHTAHLV
ncbi:MAG: aldose 1-epimerase family protein [Aquaticitalea sp.]